MQAIVLCGGLGTRLRSEVPDLPKPMAPIDDRPFLGWLLEYLRLQGFTGVTLSVGYLHEKITAWFGDRYQGMGVDYVIEDTPLGTGGAVARCLETLDSGDVYVLNGDTFVGLDYADMYERYRSADAGQRMAMALRPVDDVERYGQVTVEAGEVTGFNEKGNRGKGLINAGVYLMPVDLFDGFDMPEKFSLENDFLAVHLPLLRPVGVVADEYFIDIGVPESYRTAQRELVSALSRYRSGVD